MLYADQTDLQRSGRYTLWLSQKGAAALKDIGLPISDIDAAATKRLVLASDGTVLTVLNQGRERNSLRRARAEWHR